MQENKKGCVKYLKFLATFLICIKNGLFTAFW